MSYNGSGTFNINTAGQPVVTGTVISSSVFNALTADLATGLSTAITKDGQTTITANIPMNSYKFTGLAAGTAATDSVRLGQLQAGSATVITVTGTDTYTGTMSPALAAYAAGNMFTFVVPNTNTTACTINIDGLGAKSITRDGSTALVAGDLVANSEVTVIYDGTRFQVLNSNSKTNWTVSNALTLSAGTANGVAYLNGSKALTTGSALVFDGTGLGVGVAPSAARIYARTASTTGTAFQADNGVNSGFVVRFEPNTTLFGNDFSQPLAFLVNNSEKMRLDSSGNLGIGTSSPSTYSAKLVAYGALGTSTPALSLVNSSADNASNIAETQYWLTNSFSGTVNVAKIGAISGATGNQYGALYFSTSNAGAPTERMRLDSSGNLGLGVTPSAGNWVNFQTQRSILSGGANDRTALSYNYNRISGTNTYLGNDYATLYDQIGGQHRWFTAPSGTAGNTISFTQAMTLDASGNLGVGITSPNSRLDVVGGTGIRVNEDGSSTKVIQVRSNFAGVGPAINVATNDPLLFQTNNTERARITSGGFSRFSNDGTYISSTGNWHEMRSDQSSQVITYFSNKNASSPFGIEVDYTALDPNGTSNSFLTCYGTTTLRAGIRSNGGLANFQANDVNLSDERVKTDIKPVGSYWDKIKAIEIVAFKYKDQTHSDDNIGVIAQQVEAVAPEFIDVDGFDEKNVPEDGVPLKTVYTTDMYHAAIKALQEAMARIEKLETEVAALKGA